MDEDITILYKECDDEKALKILKVVEMITKDKPINHEICNSIRKGVEEKLKEKNWNVIEMPFSVYSISYNEIIKIKCYSYIYVIFSTNNTESTGSIFDCLGRTFS